MIEELYLVLIFTNFIFNIFTTLEFADDFGHKAYLLILGSEFQAIPCRPSVLLFNVSASMVAGAGP